MKSKLLIILVIFVVIPIAAFFLGKNYIDTTITSPNDGSAAQVLVTIEEGTSIKKLAKQLKDDGLIKDELIFEYYIRTNNLQDQILAGTYETSGRRTMVELVTDLQTPVSTEVKVTIPEGLRFTEIADRLDKVLKISPNWDKAEFLALAETPGDTFSDYEILSTKPADKSLEGFLFPDTYIFSVEVSADEVIRKFLDNTQTRISGELLEDIEASEFTVYEILNFASLIERESIFLEDRAKVGGVFYKRIRDGWPLGSDVTTLYEYGDWKYEIRDKDLKTDTPYNTRLNKGLPPTPICNPGMDSIEGIVYYEENDYYYFIGDSTGHIYYARTLSEHQKNISKYLK